MGNTENGTRRIHREDEVEVCSHHDDTWQEGDAKTKSTNAAAKCRGDPVRQPV